MVEVSEAVAYAELVIYSIICILAVMAMTRRSSHRKLGLFYVVVFCLFTITSAAFRVDSFSHPANMSDITWAAIFSLIGFAPLLLASTEFLKRVADEASNYSRINSSDANFQSPQGVTLSQRSFPQQASLSTSRRGRILQIAQIPIMTAVSLVIVGELNQPDTTNFSDGSKKSTFTHIGVVVLLIVFLVFSAIVFITAKDIKKVSQNSKRLYFVVVAAVPLLTVRLSWSQLAVFVNDSTFSEDDGEPLIRLFMAGLAEFIIAVMYLVAGFKLAS